MRLGVIRRQAQLTIPSSAKSNDTKKAFTFIRRTDLDMPDWLQWVIGLSVFVGACHVLWTKLIRPLGQLISYLHAAIPLNQALVEQFKDNADYLSVLKEIASQFKTDSGST